MGPTEVVVGWGGGGGEEADGCSGIDLARRRGGILGICTIENAEIRIISFSKCFNIENKTETK